MLFFTVAVIVYIPTNKCIRIPFSLHCPQHLLFLVFLIIVVLTCSSLVMLSIFSCAFWPFVCFLGKRRPLIFFFLIRYISFCCWDVWVLYIFWILIHYQIYALQVFFFSHLIITFSFCPWFPLLCRSFLVWYVPTSYFCFCLFWFWGQIQKNCQDWCQGVYHLWFLQGVLWLQILHSSL